MGTWTLQCPPPRPAVPDSGDVCRVTRCAGAWFLGPRAALMRRWLCVSLAVCLHVRLALVQTQERVLVSVGWVFCF